MVSEAELVAHQIIAAFDAARIDYAVGGSVASTMHGIPRLTAAVDFIADIAPEQIPALVAALSPDFYVDGDMILSALQNAGKEGGSAFNVIHLPTMINGDIFIRRNTPFYNAEWERRQKRKFTVTSPNAPVFVAAPEDMILQKLIWYRLTGERSDKQRGDVTGMLKVQNENLDKAHLEYWASELQITDLLMQAAQDAGFVL